MQWLPTKKRKTDLERELQSDLRLEEEEQREHGLSAEEARYAALRAFGNRTLIHEQTQATWSWSWLESLISDHKLWISRNGSQCRFYRVRDSHCRPRHRRRFDRLQRGKCPAVASASLPRPGTAGLDFQRGKLQHPGRTLFRSSRSESVLLRPGGLGRVPQHGRPGIDWVGRARAAHEHSGHGKLLRLAGRATRYRTICLRRRSAKASISAPPAMLLSDSFWRRRFAADPKVVGQTLTLNNHPVTVAGVLPASFDFAGVFAPGTPIDVFIPWPAHGPNQTRRKHDEHRRQVKARR